MVIFMRLFYVLSSMAWKASKIRLNPLNPKLRLHFRLSSGFAPRGIEVVTILLQSRLIGIARGEVAFPDVHCRRDNQWFLDRFRHL